VAGTRGIKGARPSIAANSEKEHGAPRVLPVHADPGTDFDPDEEELIAELIVPPQSELLRQPLMSTDLQGDPEIQIIAVCFGSSDYFKLGIPLNILVFVSGSLFIPVIWQF